MEKIRISGVYLHPITNKLLESAARWGEMSKIIDSALFSYLEGDLDNIFEQFKIRPVQCHFDATDLIISKLDKFTLTSDEDQIMAVDTPMFTWSMTINPVFSETHDENNQGVALSNIYHNGGRISSYIERVEFDFNPDLIIKSLL